MQHENNFSIMDAFLKVALLSLAIYISSCSCECKKHSQIVKLILLGENQIVAGKDFLAEIRVDNESSKMVVADDFSSATITLHFFKGEKEIDGEVRLISNMGIPPQIHLDSYATRTAYVRLSWDNADEFIIHSNGYGYKLEKGLYFLEARYSDSEANSNVGLRLVSNKIKVIVE